MKKILLLTTLSILLVHCNKKTELPELAKDNDYANFDLKDRPCEINQKVTVLVKSNFTSDDKNIKFTFSENGYLISESIYNDSDVLLEENTFEKLEFPLTKKQIIGQEDYILTKITYDSLKNIVNKIKLTNKDQMIEEQNNTFSDNYVVREDYFTSGSAKPLKVVKIVRNGDMMKNKVIYNQMNKILDSIVYEYQGKKITKETHYNADKKITSTQLFSYEGKNISAIAYLNALGKEEAVEKFSYNENNDLTKKFVFSAADQSNYEEIYMFNKANKLQKSETKLNENVLVTNDFQYDDNNNIIKFETNNYTNKENLTKTFTYNYDKKGNWISKEISYNNVPTYKITRTIKYCNE